MQHIKIDLMFISIEMHYILGNLSELSLHFLFSCAGRRQPVSPWPAFG